MRKIPPSVIERLESFLEEDIRSGDLTSELTVPSDKTAVATIYAKEKAILAGIEEVAAIAEFSGLEYEVLTYEGNWTRARQPVMRLKGNARTLLAVERVCLNIVMRMSGIATKTYRMVAEARKGNPKVKVAATRKTTPGFRYFEKRAVVVGGGDPHRYALDDMVLIKNNHITAAGGVKEAVTAAKESVSFSKKVSCEARTLQEALDAINAGADIILLDNFKAEDVGGVVKVLEKEGLRHKVLLEVSGGMTEDSAHEYAKTGIDVISSGSLTHSYKASDFNMLLSLN